MNIAIFGAGCTGRGHLNALLYEGNYRNITFIDKNDELVKLLKEKKKYTLHLLGKNERTFEIDGFETLHRNEEDAIIQTCINSDIVLTAVIAENLDNVSEVIAKAITVRRRKGNEKVMNIIACENLDNASTFLKNSTFARLSDADKAYSDKYIGFPDAMISRVVPLTKSDPLFMIAEDYNEWVVRKSDYMGPDPEIPFMNLISNLEARLERKIWIHNGGHATVAYMGWLRGYQYIHEAVADAEIATFAGKVMDEIGDVIIHKHGFPKNEIEEYKNDLGPRGANAEMKDEIVRVVRDPVRKLGVKDRLMAPALYAEKHGLPNRYIIQSLKNILKYYNPDDPEAVRMHRIIGGYNLNYFLEETIGLKNETGLVKKIAG